MGETSLFYLDLKSVIFLFCSILECEHWQQQEQEEIAVWNIERPY